MPTYSYGEDSPLKFEISDDLAKYYNEAVEQYFKAQRRFNQKFGRPWEPSVDAIEINWSRRQKRAWNAVGHMMKQVIKESGPYHVNEIMDDFLVKNVLSQTVCTISERLGRVLIAAAMSGALYGLLRGR